MLADKLLKKIGKSREDFDAERAAKLRIEAEVRADRYRAREARAEPSNEVEHEFWNELGKLEERLGVELHWSDCGVWIE